MIAALTTTVLGMGGPMGFPALRESLGLTSADSCRAGGLGRASLGARHFPNPGLPQIRTARWSGACSLVTACGPISPQAGWYAVFPASASSRAEETAIGYVYGDLLKPDRPPEVTVPLVRILP